MLDKNINAKKFFHNSNNFKNIILIEFLPCTLARTRRQCKRSSIILWCGT